MTSEDTNKAIDAKQGDADPACRIERTDDAWVGGEPACGCAEQRIAGLHRQAAGENEGSEIQRAGPARRQRELPGKRGEQCDRQRIGEGQQEGPAKADAPYRGALGRCVVLAQRALREPKPDPDQRHGRCQRERLPIVLEQAGKLGAGGEGQYRVDEVRCGNAGCARQRGGEAVAHAVVDDEQRDRSDRRGDGRAEQQCPQFVHESDPVARIIAGLRKLSSGAPSGPAARRGVRGSSA